MARSFRSLQMMNCLVYVAVYQNRGTVKATGVLFLTFKTRLATFVDLAFANEAYPSNELSQLTTQFEAELAWCAKENST